MRPVTPKKRFTTIPFLGNQLALNKAPLASFTFQSDVVIHNVTSQVQISLNFPADPFTPGRVVIAGGFDGPGNLPGSGQTGYVHVHRFSTGRLINVPAPLAVPLWLSTDCDAMYIASGSTFYIVSEESLPPSPLVDCEGTFIISYNTLSEWMTFRPPHIGTNIPGTGVTTRIARV